MARRARATGLKYRRGWAPAAILTLSLIVRLGVIAATPHFQPLNDASDYDTLARAVASSGHFPPTTYARLGSAAALRPPGYPLMLAAVYKLAGPSWTAGRVAGALLGVVTVALLMLIASRLWGRRVAMVAGTLAALYLPLVMVNASLLSEALFLPLMLALVLMLVSWSSVRTVTPGGAVSAGVLCGLAALTRSVGLLLILPALVCIWSRGTAVRRRLMISALVLAAASATIAPWTLRNAHAFGAFVPVSTQDWVTAVGTYNVDSGRAGPQQGIWRPFFFINQYRRLIRAGWDENQLDTIMRRETLNYIAAHPIYPAVVFGLNTARLFGLGPGHIQVERSWYGEMGIPLAVQPWTRWSVYVITLLAGLAVLVLRPRRGGRDRAFLWLVPIVLFLSVVFIHGGPRYRVPLDPFLVLAASVGLSTFNRRQHSSPLGFRGVRAPT